MICLRVKKGNAHTGISFFFSAHWAYTDSHCLIFFLLQTVNQGGDQELENLVTKLAILKDLLSSIEKKVHTYHRLMQVTFGLGTHFL